MNGKVFRIQLWELWRLTRQEILWRGLFAVLMAGVVYGFAILIDPEPGGSEAYVILMSLSYVGLCCGAGLPFLYSPALALSEDWRHFLKAQFARPVTTPQLLGVPLAYDVAVRLAGHTVLAWAFVWWSGLALPVGPVVLFTAAAGATFYLAVAAYPGPWHLLGSLAVASGILFAVLLPEAASGYAILEGAAQWRQLFSLSPLDWAVVAALAVAYGGFAWYHIDLQRHGARTAREVRESRDKVAIAVTGPKPAPFRSPLRAQLWMELRRTADLWQAVLVIAPLMVGLSALASWWEFPPRFFATLWLVAFILGPALFILGGATQLSGMKIKPGDAKLSVFEATQTLPVAPSIALKAAVLFFTNTMGNLIIIVASLLSWRLFPPQLPSRLEGKVERLFEIASLLDSVPSAFAAALVVSTAALTLILLSLCGTYASQRVERAGWRYRSDRAFSVFVVAYIILGVVDRFSAWDLAPLWIATAWLLAAALVGVAAWGLWNLLQTKLFSAMAFGGVVIVWVAFLAGAAYLVAQVSPSLGWDWAGNVHIAAFCIGLLFVPLSSFAWAPLALAQRRSA